MNKKEKRILGEGFMEHKDTYLMMMDALDDELANEQQVELDAHLRACPPCRQEWQAILAVHTLLQQTPALAPAADFAQRTIARLPNRRARLAVTAVIYSLLLLGGILPLALVLVLVFTISPIFQDPGILGSLWAMVQQGFSLIGTVISALLAGLGELAIQQPAIIGWFLVILGIVSVWGGVSRQLIFQPNSRQIQ
jgi:anti-sigma factor RsiW